MCIKTAAMGTIALFQNIDAHMGAGQCARSDRGRALFKRGMAGDTGVSFWFKRGKAGLCAHLRVEGSGIRFAVLSEEGWMRCSCPDHAKGNICKHLRALAGLTVKKATTPNQGRTSPAPASNEAAMAFTGGITCDGGNTAPHNCPDWR